MPCFIDLTGQRFGRIVVKKLVQKSSRKERTKTRWLCECDCGGTRVVASSELRNGDCSSCGCLKRERILASITKHGLSHKVPEYNSWQNMLRRCTTPTNPNYEIYGGRGISVCERWSCDDGFANFMEDMGPSPGRGYSIDRIDVNGNYEHRNCRWATQKQQMGNYRGNLWVEINGERKVMADWIRNMGLNRATIYKRIKSGMSPAEALLRKPHRGKPLVPK